MRQLRRIINKQGCRALRRVKSIRLPLLRIGITHAVLLMSGCSAVQLPKIDAYQLSGVRSECAAVKQSKSAKSLAVSAPEAGPGYGTTKMAYVITPYQISYFTRNRWVAPPQQMLLPIVVQALRAQDYFKAVVPAPQVARTAYRLHLNLLAIEQDFLLPSSRERVRIQATLMDNHLNQVVASHCFSSLESAKMNTPYGGVLAANQAVSRLANQISSWTVSALNSPHR